MPSAASSHHPLAPPKRALTHPLSSLKWKPARGFLPQQQQRRTWLGEEGRRAFLAPQPLSAGASSPPSISVLVKLILFSTHRQVLQSQGMAGQQNDLSHHSGLLLLWLCSDGPHRASMGPRHETWWREHINPIRIQWMLLSSLESPTGKGDVGVQVSKDTGG